uniref:PEPxxWA-CTERM sorting domain-containing protein n=1 Tax=uncultured Sphingomonas sp. TaxID=158754 RepID=UPI0035CC30BF
MNVAMVACLIVAGLAVTDERSLLPFGSGMAVPKAFAVVAPLTVGGGIGGGIPRQAFGRRGPARTGFVPGAAPGGSNSGLVGPTGFGDSPRSFVSGIAPSSPDQVAALTTPAGGAGVPGAASLPGIAGGGSTPSGDGGSGGGGSGGGGTGGGGTGGGGTGGGGTGGGPPIAAVPEPATWAIMVLGFGFAGIAARRARRKRLAAARSAAQF